MTSCSAFQAAELLTSWWRTQCEFWWTNQTRAKQLGSSICTWYLAELLLLYLNADPAALQLIAL